MKFGVTLIVCVMIWGYVSIGGTIIALSGSQVTDTGSDYLGNPCTVVLCDQDTIQYKVGNFLVYPGSILSPLLFVVINRFRESIFGSMGVTKNEND